MKILAEEVLSYPVQFAEYDGNNVYNWTGMIAGNVHVSFDVWVTTDSRKKYIKDFALSSNRTIESAGANGQNVQSGWFVPEWVVDAYPALASYRGLKDPNVARVLALNASTIAKIPKPVFAQPSTNKTEWFDSNNKALVLTVLPSYANDPNPKLIKNLGLSALAEYAGSDDSFTTSMWREMTLAGMPVLFSLWAPHQFLAEYVYRNDNRFKMVRLALPAYDARICGTGDNLNCDFDSTFPQKILSSSLQGLSDELYWLAKQLSLTNDDLNLMLGQISYKNATIEAAVCTWMKNNQDTWKNWLWFRNCAGGCGANGYCTFNKCACNQGYEGANCESLRVIHWVEWNSGVGIAVLFVTSLMLLSIVGVTAILVINKSTEVVKAQGFVFNVLILVSLVPGLLGPFFAIGEPTVANCSVKIWIPCISFVLIIGSLLVRNYRIVSIFSAKKKLGNGPLVIDYYSWDSGNIYNYLMKILAEEVLSYPVQFAEYDGNNVYNWTGMIAGNVHVSFDVWVTTDSRKKYIKDFALSSNRTIESAGANGQNVQSGWFVPEWVVDAYPALASYRGLKDPNVARVLALNASTIAKIPKPVFAQPSTNKTEWFDSNNKALVLTVLPSYANDPNPKLIKNLGLSALAEYAGSDDSFTTSMWREMTLAGMPVLFSLWAPHQFLAEYVYRNDNRFKMVRLALPAYDARICGTGDNLNCDFDSTFPQKILSSSLQGLSDELYWLAKQLSLTNDDLNLMLGQISYKNATIEAAVCTWMKNNQDTWKNWLWFRNCAGGCGANGYCTFNKCACNQGYEGANCESLRVIHWVEWNSGVGIAVLFVTSIMLLSIVGLTGVLVVNKAAEVVKAQGFVFNVLPTNKALNKILVSLVPGLIGPFFAIGEPTVANCSIKIWFPCISFVFIIGSLLVRNYRIVSIFSAKKKLVNVTDLKLLLFLLPFILGEIALLILLSTAGKPSVQIIQDGGSGKWIKSCQFDNIKAITPSLIVYKVALVLGAVFLAYKTRDIPDRFGESKSIALAIYNMAVVSASFIVVLFIVKVDEIIWFVIYSLTVILVSAVFESIFFGRIIYFIVFKNGVGDQEDLSRKASLSQRGSSLEQSGASATRKNQFITKSSNGQV
ncbi:hypothetical protein HDU97_003593 [Phlyctochytrium planicorne]|nr:hypothetical protein HDU97_003593 [Phlyctochytrium planicorne]